MRRGISERRPELRDGEEGWMEVEEESEDRRY